MYGTAHIAKSFVRMTAKIQQMRKVWFVSTAAKSLRVILRTDSRPRKHNGPIKSPSGLKIQCEEVGSGKRN